MDLSLVFQSGDAVLISVFLLLVLMSIATWTIIVVRVIKLRKAKAANAAVRERFWAAKNLEEAVKVARENESPMSRLVQDSVKACEFYQRNKGTDLSSGVSVNQYLTRQIGHTLGEIRRESEGGMTMLATVGSTAPFIGLFGTVWGIYHALINISNSGQMNIAAVAGPIGEALVATAAGLFVAIPAVLAYNFLNRSNKTLAQDMNAFAHDLHIQVLQGHNHKE
ncbi:MAG: MotA/TolQ/ExbB proton channel family protein [Neisseria sp.]|nr:MotA/TolQ/ExbB proton channel family protein [Neisseria sp.]